MKKKNKTKTEFFAKTEAEYQKQDVMDIKIQIKKRTEVERRKKVTLNNLFTMLTDDEFSELMHKIKDNKSREVSVHHSTLRCSASPALPPGKGRAAGSCYSPRQTRRILWKRILKT